MFKKVLIANRGEIASRIIKTCKTLNIKTVAVYSEVDEQAIFVQEADEAFLIGEAPATESYMNIDKIIEMAHHTNADAIHPGYGFLSENPAFAARCELENIIYIGPTSNNIELMANKIKARELMQQAGVPVVPGTASKVVDVQNALKLAEEIGYPVMIKAASGGGGIGMQKIYDEVELEKAFMSNSERAKRFFGDGSMFIEKLIENAHHVEVQIIADHFGNIVHLYERECSIQRRNQKVVEEALSPSISEETRIDIGKKAILAAKQIGYQNIGTVEFIMDENEQFYFLEMNTRIQVEHPITEEITGFDLVEEQLNIASGKEINYKQENIKTSGHAIEVRIYAEDPKTFFPSPGLISKLILPKGENIRNEVSIASGQKVTPFYDPMIAKLIVKDATRELAIDRMIDALETYKIEGIKTNIPMLQAVLTHEAFKSGLTTTNFLEKYDLKL